MNTPKYPRIEVTLTGTDGNAFAIIGAVSEALRRGGVPRTEVKAFQDEAMASDYDHLLRTACSWVEVFLMDLYLCSRCGEGIVKDSGNGWGECPVCGTDHDMKCLDALTVVRR